MAEVRNPARRSDARRSAYDRGRSAAIALAAATGRHDRGVRFLEASAAGIPNIFKGERRKEGVGFEALMRLRPVEMWILILLRLAGGELCCKAKIMKLLFLVERVYGVMGIMFKPGPWSKDVEKALRRLVRLGLVEEAPNEPERAYRLTEAGYSVVEEIPVDMGWEYPYLRAKTFIDWGVEELTRYIQINYPEYSP
jgi:predicted transcriptional regulator